jgi:hypothetical protein
VNQIFVSNVSATLSFPELFVFIVVAATTKTTVTGSDIIATTMSVWKEPSAKNAFILSVVSVLLELIATIVGIAYYVTTGSSLTLVFGLENVVVRASNNNAELVETKI